MTDDALCGNDVATYAETRFRDLWHALPLSLTKVAVRAGCEVVDHDRGLRSWVDLGDRVLYVPSSVAYDPIYDRTRSGIDAQAREHVFGLQEFLSQKLE